MKCSIVSQLISLITGALVEEKEEEGDGDKIDDPNEESRGGATIQIMPRPINTSYNDSRSNYNPSL
jgi:hypothetical protein